MADSLATLKRHFKGRRSQNALTVYVVQRSVSRSGMMRKLSLFIVRDGVLLDITKHAADVVGFSFDRDSWAIRVHGCGMNMHFHAVYELSYALYGDGYRLTHASL